MEYPIRVRRGAPSTTMGGGGGLTTTAATSRPRRTRANDDDDDDDARKIDGEEYEAPLSSSSSSSSSSSRKKKFSSDDDVLDFPVSSAHVKTANGKSSKCRAISCPKTCQGNSGFCRAHHNQYLICTGRCESWTCMCGNRVVDFMIRCGTCHRWKGGKHPLSSSLPAAKKKIKNDAVVALNTGALTHVPPDAGVQISEKQLTNDRGRSLCKVIGCGKLIQSNNDGFCRMHFNTFAVEEGADDDLDGRTCACGKSMSGGKKRCGNCRTPCAVVSRRDGRDRSNDDDRRTMGGGKTTTTTASRSSRKKTRVGVIGGGTTNGSEYRDATTTTMTKTKTNGANNDRDEDLSRGGKFAWDEGRRRDRHPPRRYVARPSRSGWGVDDGDVAFLLMAEATVATATASSSTVASGGSSSLAGEDDDDDKDDDGHHPGGVVVAATSRTTTTTTTTTSWLGSWWGLEDGNDVAAPVVDGGDAITPLRRQRRGKRDKRDLWPRSTIFDDGSSSGAAAAEVVPVEGEGPAKEGVTGPPSPSLKTNGSEGRDGGVKRRATGRRLGDDDEDQKDDDWHDDCSDEDEVVFVSSSRVEGMGDRGAGSRYSGRLRRGRDDLSSPRRLLTERTRRRRRGPRSDGDIAVDDRREFGPKFGDADVGSERESVHVPAGVDDWTCACGKLVDGRRKRCDKCKKWRGGSNKSKAKSMCPIEIARCGECDGLDGGDRLVSTASSRMHDIRSPVVSKDWDRLGSRGVTKVTDDHSSGNARGTGERQVSQDCDDSNNKPDVISDRKRHITPDDLRMENSFIEDDGLSLSELGPQTLPLVTKEPVRQKRLLDAGVSFCEQTYWRCSHCGGLNSPTAQCGTCRHFQVSKRETVLLERTRFELLNGRDFWICTVCEIAMPSLTAPCGSCRKMISFVPLEIGEFEEFVRKQRETGAFLRQGPVHEKDVLKSG